MLIGLQIGKREVKELLILHNLRMDHVSIRSELRYLIGAKVVRFKWRVFGGETGPIATVRVFEVVATIRFRIRNRSSGLDTSREYREVPPIEFDRVRFISSDADCMGTP
jgi:hypothetical protein